MSTFFETLKLHQVSKKEQVLEVLQSQDAIWLDFEMRKEDARPALAGMIVDDVFSQVVFDEALAGAVSAKAKSGALIKFMHFKDWCNDIYESCLKGAALIGYTTHERETIDGCWLEKGFSTNNSFYYLDANVTKLVRQSNPSLLQELNSKQRSAYEKVGLKDFLQHSSSGYDYPRHLRGFKPATQIQRLRDQNNRYDEYSQWSKGSKRAWSNLLTYNKHDVLGMKHLALRLLSKWVQA